MFKVPIIPPDLRHEETIIQAAYALDCLQNTIVTIFGRIDRRIEKNNVKVKELQERIKKSQGKINSLQGTRKAIRIYAPARFPASNIFKDLPVTFEEELKLTPRPVEKYQVKNKLDINLPSLNEKLIFFHVRDQNSVKMTPENSLARERCNIKQDQDLGSIPSDLKSIPSVLLFNTDLSAYNLDEYDSGTLGKADSWKRARLFKNKRQQHENNQSGSAKQILEPAPYSLVNRRNEKLTPSGGLKYTPTLCEAPELDLPLDLPDLPGIADDLRYESPEAKLKIAPSLAVAVENLPELAELMKDDDKKDQTFIEATESNIAAGPPPPPPPPPPLSKSPVPPPPPPPREPHHSTSQMTSNTTDETKLLTKSTDTRSELMAAIRNAGGKARLRPTAAAPLSNANNKDVVDNTRSGSIFAKKASSLGSSKGGDLMADLHNKLLMRRKGISGSKHSKDDASNIKNVDDTTSTNTFSGNPVISHLSSLIPAPSLTKRSARNTATTSEEDDDDSNDNEWAD